MAKLHYDKELTETEKKKYAKFLAEDEELELVTGYSSLYLRQRFIIQIIIPGAIFILIGAGGAYFMKVNIAYGLILGLVLSCLFSLLLTWIITQSHRYLLTTRRVIIREGFLHLRVTSALYDKITHIEVDQGLTDRIFLHHGTILLNTAGGSKDLVILKYVEYPVEFKNILERLIHQERRFLPQTGEIVHPLEEYTSA